MKRTKLSDRLLPVYSKGEETMNMVTHIVVLGSILQFVSIFFFE